MCRLLGWVARQPQCVADVLGPAALAGFTELSRQHADGWGMAWWPGGRDGAPQVARAIACAADDPGYADLTGSALADSGFVHLRWATPGLPVVQTNTHPFLRGRIALAHNGAIHPLDRIGEMIPPGWEAQARGTTDSERYFLALAARLERGEPVAAAVGEVVRHIFATLNPTSLNATLLSPEALHMVSAYDPARVPMIGASSGGASASSEPDTTFYELSYRTGADTVVVASSGFPQPEAQGWRRLPNMSMLTIERGTLDMAVTTLAA